MLAGSLLIHGSLANAQIIDYSYVGKPFYVPGNDSYHSYPLKIHFQIDDGLISSNGHFEKSFDLTSQSASPFVNFSMSYDEGWDGITDNYDIYPPRISVSLGVMFDTDSSGNIQSWNIKANMDDNGGAGGSGGTYNLESYSYVLSDGAWVSTRDRMHSYSNYYDSSDGSVRTTERSGSLDYAPYAPTSAQWTRTVAPVPLPGALLLFLSGFSGLLWRKWLAR
jgi:hypothetical protein